MAVSKNVVFDVVGTLACYDKFHEAIDRTIGDRLRHQGIGVEAFASLWIEVCGREYTNLSISGYYTPSSKIFKSLFYRILYQCGVPDPHSFASDEEKEAIIAGYGDLRFRPGAKECIEKLREAGFTVWGLTTGNRETVLGYFTNSGVEMSIDNLMACDDIRMAKPDLECYKPSLKKLSAQGRSPPWFAAAHLWDSSAAKKAGYRGAYCTEHEGEFLDIFGDMDVVGDTLPEMADKIIAASQ